MEQISKGPYQLAPAKLKDLKAQLESMLEARHLLTEHRQFLSSWICLFVFALIIDNSIG